MKLEEIKNKKICILGWGIENQALLLFLLKKKLKAEFTICDSKQSIKKIKNNQVKYNLGAKYDKGLKNFDIIFRSPGYPLFSKKIVEAREKGVKISSPMKLFFNLCPSKNIVGITGTKGKGTTSSLIYKVIKASGQRVWLGGNIGIAPFSFFSKIKTGDWVVLELSSFQLEDFETSPRIAVITNFSAEHLAPADPANPNYHKSLGAYWQAKANIFKYQGKRDCLVANKKLKSKINPEFSGQKSKFILFNKSDLDSKLVGEYNKKNVAAAAEVAKLIKIKKNIIEKAVKNFKGLPHRIEFVKKVKGVKYYDNSFATTPEATIEDLKSFFCPIILMLGGADKGSDFFRLAKAVRKKVKFVVLLDGKATPRIKKELYKTSFPQNKIKLVHNMKEALKIASSQSLAGDIVLLSTACASFGMFKNYKERGDLFQEEVKKLKI